MIRINLCDRKIKAIAFTRRYRKSHPYVPHPRKRDRAFNKKAYQRAWTLKRKYGITPEQFDVMWTEQGGVCAMCYQDLWPGKSTHTDHDHSTGRVRALLCGPCNLYLGFYEDKKMAGLASEYLRTV